MLHPSSLNAAIDNIIIGFRHQRMDDKNINQHVYAFLLHCFVELNRLPQTQEVADLLSAVKLKQHEYLVKTGLVHKDNNYIKIVKQFLKLYETHQASMPNTQIIFAFFD